MSAQELLGVGVILGLSAGIAPGPLFALLVAETLRHGSPAGLRVALAPLITDLPIILVTVFLLSALRETTTLLGLVSLVGAALLLHMGIGHLRSRGLPNTVGTVPAGGLGRAIAVNLLSPHPYLFWLSVGGTYLAKAMQIGESALILFLAGFYACLVGTKLVLALVIGRSRALLDARVWVFLLRLTGALLCLLGIGLFFDGIALLGLVAD